MAKVMEWNGLNLSARNFTTGTRGPGDLSATYIENSGSIQWGQWDVGGGKKDWGIQRNNVRNKKSAFEFGSLGSRGGGNLNGREFQVAFYMRFSDVGASVGSRFRFFRAYDVNGRWLATLRFTGRYSVELTDDTGNSVSLGNITPSAWTRFEVSYNRRSGVIAARQASSGVGSWKRITMNATMKGRPRLDRVTFGSYEADSPSWFQIRNIRVHDDSLPIDPYVPPKAPTISSSIISRRIAENESVIFSATPVQGDAAINGQWWDIRQGSIWTIPALSAPYPMEPTSKTYSGEELGEGQFVVTFTVRDTNNFVVNKSFGLTVGAADGPPEATLLFPPAFVGQTSTLAATVVSPGQNATGINEIEWTQEDGPAEVDIVQPTSLSTPVGPFTQPGSYTFNIRLTNDKDLAMEYTVSQEIEVTVPPATSIVTPAEDVVEMLTGETVTFEATAVSGSLPIIVKEWSTTPTGGQITGQGTETANIRFPIADTYNVSFSVTDNLGTTTVSENKVIQVSPAIPPSVIFPPDMTINLNEQSEIFVSAVVEEGSYPRFTAVWEVVESPENVGATIEPDGDSATIKDFTENGFYRIQLTVGDSTGINFGIGEFQVFVYDSTRPIDPKGPIDPLDLMTNTQLQYMASQRMSGTPDGNTTQIIKRYYLSVVEHPDKYSMSFHQLEREYYKGIVNGDIDVTLALYGLIDGGGALRPLTPADGDE